MLDVYLVVEKSVSAEDLPINADFYLLKVQNSKIYYQPLPHPHAGGEKYRI